LRSQDRKPPIDLECIRAHNLSAAAQRDIRREVGLAARRRPDNEEGVFQSEKRESRKSWTVFSWLPGFQILPAFLIHPSSAVKKKTGRPAAQSPPDLPVTKDVP
jgi:hypothetical protein